MKSRNPAENIDPPSRAAVQLSSARILAGSHPAQTVFVVLGMHCSGGVMLARMLQLLGVDMVDPSDPVTETRWERRAISRFNDRLLELIGRPLAYPSHSLPFPAGWWGRPEISAIRKEMRDYLRSALADGQSHWGFKDPRVARLLPFYHQLFEELGVFPIYLWVVRDPAQCSPLAVRSGIAPNAQLAEAMWLVYNAEAQKFIGNDVAAIIDYARWIEQPEAIAEQLYRTLPLSWRGSKTELVECVRALAREEGESVGPGHMTSALVAGFYDSIRDTERSESSLRHSNSVVQAVDIMRSLIAPYVGLLQPEPGTREAARLPAATTGTAGDDKGDEGEGEEALRRELADRIAENRWLQQQYAEQKRALADTEDRLQALAESGVGQTNLRTELEMRSAELRASRLEIDELREALDKAKRQNKAEIKQLREALELERAANERYLARIYELKMKCGGDGRPAAGTTSG